MRDAPAGSSRADLNRNLVLAAENVARRWFPVEQGTLCEIRARLESGQYDDNPSGLLTDLKKDLGLYTWCLRSLSQSKAIKGLASSGISPLELFSRAGSKELLRALAPETPELQSHQLSDASAAQLAQLRQALISSSTAELLSSAAGLDGEQAFTAAIFRQIGLLLISWNYPHVYSRAVRAIKNSEDLDKSLTRMLGFSPALLGITISRKCCLSAEVRVAAGDKAALIDCGDPRESERICDGLERICRVGEALARASDPELHPQAEKDWLFARNEITNALGPEGLQALSRHVESRCRNYARTSSEVFGVSLYDSWTSSETVRLKPAASQAFQSNSHLQQCSPLLKERLRLFYEKLNPLSISREATDDLTRDILPQAGFPRGCIYLIEPDSLLLVPRLPVGKSLLRDYRAVKCTGPISHFHPVAAAFGCKTPIMEENVELGESLVTYIAGVLGEGQRAGVLYLEPSPRLLSEKNHTALVTYKALRQAVCDCLGLR